MLLEGSVNNAVENSLTDPVTFATKGGMYGNDVEGFSLDFANGRYVYGGRREDSLSVITDSRGSSQSVTNLGTYLSTAPAGVPAIGRGMGYQAWGGATNQYGWSEDFSLSGTTNLTRTLNAAIAPNGEQTAAKYETNGTNVVTYNAHGGVTLTGTDVCMSWHVKAGVDLGHYLKFGLYDSTTTSGVQFIDFDMTTMDWATPGANRGVIPMADGWCRIWFTTPITNGNTFATYHGATGSVGWLTGQSWYVWGHQIEEGTFPTPYIPTAGGVPATRLGSNVQAVQGLGDELVVNGDFDTPSDWVTGAGWTISGGRATKSPGVGDAITQPNGSMSPSVTYRITYTVSGSTTGVCAAILTADSQVTGNLIGGNGERTEDLIGTAGVDGFGITANTAFDGSIDIISVREVFPFPGYNRDEGTFVVEWDAPLIGVPSPSRCLLHVGNEDWSDRMLIFAESSGTILKIGVGIADGWSSGPAQLVGASGFAGRHKVACTYGSDGDLSICMDGGTVISASKPVPSGLSQTAVGHNGHGGQNLNGDIKSIRYIPRRVSDAELQEMTS